MLEETRREQLNYLAKVTKIQKQLEAVKKKGDQSKYQSLESEVLAVSEIHHLEGSQAGGVSSYRPEGP